MIMLVKKNYFKPLLRGMYEWWPLLSYKCFQLIQLSTIYFKFNHVIKLTNFIVILPKVTKPFATRVNLIFLWIVDEIIKNIRDDLKAGEISSTRPKMIGREFDPNWFEEIPGTNRSGLLCNQGIEFFFSSAKSIALHLARTSPSFRLRSWRNSIIVSIRLHALVEVINSSTTIVLLRWSSSRHRSLRYFVPEKSFVPFFCLEAFVYPNLDIFNEFFISFFFIFLLFRLANKLNTIAREV